MTECKNGKSREMTEEEVAELESQAQAAEREYWENVSYEDAVNAEIRKQYTESNELALLRQRDEKPDEYAQYYAYCEGCKAFVKQKKEEYEWQ